MTNWQLYRGSGRTKSAARRDALRRAVSCSVQLPDPTTVSDMVPSTSIDTTADFTLDPVHPPTNAQNESIMTEDVFTQTSSSWRRPDFVSTGSCFASTAAAPNDGRHNFPTTETSTDMASPTRRWRFNAAVALHDVRPSARYERHTALNNGDVHATVTVDEQHFEGFGATWRAAKRNAASRALFHILQLRHLTSDIKLQR